MKHVRFRLLAVATLGLIAFSACKKDKDNGASSQFSATISGTAFAPSAVSAVHDQSIISITAVQPTSTDTMVMTLYIPDTAQVNNNVTFNQSTIVFEKVKSGTFYQTYGGNPSHGIITFTSYDKTNKKIAGNFSGVVYNDVNK